MKVYVAASSKELDRAECAMRNLRKRGHDVTHDWVDIIRRVGSANPTDATPDQCAAWAQEDLDGVAQADVLWLLMPEDGGAGAYWEAGYAQGLGKRVVVSGFNHRKSVFTANTDAVYDSDSLACNAEFSR